MQNRERSSVLVLGAHRQSLAVVRALRTYAPRIVFGHPGTSGASFVGRSRWVDALWRHPALDRDCADFVAALRVFLEHQPDVGFVVPVGDTEIRALDRARDALPARAKYLMASRSVLETCRNKPSLFAIARAIGIPVANFVSGVSGEAVLGAADDIGYPCVIKAETEELRAFGHKALIVRARADLKRALEQRPQSHPLLVQSYVPGARHNLYFFAEAGVVRAVTQVEILRTDRRDGTGYAVEGVTVPTDVSWREHLTRLALRVGYEGPGCLQFIEDGAKGRTTLLELNPRLGANHAAVENAGLHLPRWWIERLECGRASIPNPFTYAPGRRYGWFYGDVAGWLSTLDDPTVSLRERLAWGASLVHSLTARDHVVWDWRDPRPAIHLYGSLLAQQWALRRPHAQRTLKEPRTNGCEDSLRSRPKKP